MIFNTINTVADLVAELTRLQTPEAIRSTMVMAGAELDGLVLTSADYGSQSADLTLSANVIYYLNSDAQIAPISDSAALTSQLQSYVDTQVLSVGKGTHFMGVVSELTVANATTAIEGLNPTGEDGKAYLYVVGSGGSFDGTTYTYGATVYGYYSNGELTFSVDSDDSTPITTTLDVTDTANALTGAALAATATRILNLETDAATVNLRIETAKQEAIAEASNLADAAQLAAALDATSKADAAEQAAIDAAAIDATSKANAAEQAAIDAAALDATSKANAAEQAAIDAAALDATSKANAAEQAAIDAAALDATSKANAAEQAAIDAAALDATSKANAAEQAAKDYFDANAYDDTDVVKKVGDGNVQEVTTELKIGGAAIPASQPSGYGRLDNRVIVAYSSLPLRNNIGDPITVTKGSIVLSGLITGSYISGGTIVDKRNIDIIVTNTTSEIDAFFVGMTPTTSYLGIQYYTNPAGGVTVKKQGVSISKGIIEAEMLKASTILLTEGGDNQFYTPQRANEKERVAPRISVTIGPSNYNRTTGEIKFVINGTHLVTRPIVKQKPAVGIKEFDGHLKSWKISGSYLVIETNPDIDYTGYVIVYKIN